MVASSNNTLTLSYRDSHSSSSPPSHYPYAQEESPLPSYFGTPFNFTDPLLFVIIINLGCLSSAILPLKLLCVVYTLYLGLSLLCYGFSLEAVKSCTSQSMDTDLL